MVPDPGRLAGKIRPMKISPCAKSWFEFFQAVADFCVMDELELELKVGFLEEAAQLLQDAEQCFLQIESSPEDAETINQLFRLAHNLKGSAKAVGFSELGAFTHLIESLLLKIKKTEIKVNSSIVDLLLACKDQLQVMIDGLKADLNASFDCSALNQRLELAMAEKEDKSAQFAEAIEVVAADQSSPQFHEPEFAEQEELVEEVILDVPSGDSPGFEEISDEGPLEMPATLAVDSIAQETSLTTKPAEVDTTEKSKSVTGVVDESIRVSLNRVDQLINYVGEMVILQSVLMEQSYKGDLAKIRKTVHQLGKISKELQDVSMSLRMVPLKTTFQKMQRIVRDTSQSLNKVVTLNLQGEETEVEKTVLELIGDPLVHLVRNAVDHGIDSAEERALAGKASSGTVTLRAYHQADSIVLEVIDDGKGIDADRLRTKAVEKGILKAGQVITDKQAINLIFHPGFSTKQAVSDISGRGVGLDVVKTNIEKLQGTVEVSTELHKGSKFRIQLPLTLAIIDATTVKLNDQRFAIPMAQIHESVQVKELDIHSSVNIGEIINLRGENLKVFRLNSLLGIKDQGAAHPRILLVSRIDEEAFGILVHDISSMQQIVVKKLGAELVKMVGVTGSAILGDGKPALILDLPRLIARPITGSTLKSVLPPTRMAT